MRHINLVFLTVAIVSFANATASVEPATAKFWQQIQAGIDANSFSGGAEDYPVTDRENDHIRYRKDRKLENQWNLAGAQQCNGLEGNWKIESCQNVIEDRPANNSQTIMDRPIYINNISSLNFKLMQKDSCGNIQMTFDSANPVTLVLSSSYLSEWADDFTDYYNKRRARANAFAYRDGDEVVFDRFGTSPGGISYGVPFSRTIESIRESFRIVDENEMEYKKIQFSHKKSKKRFKNDSDRQQKRSIKVVTCKLTK